MVKAVVGANWGDEGKGKITDMLAGNADFVVRFQGGANAGHTIKNKYGKFALHTLPSGVFNEGVTTVSYTHLGYLLCKRGRDIIFVKLLGHGKFFSRAEAFGASLFQSASAAY